MNQSPVSRAERDNNFEMDIYFPDTRTSDEVACAQALLQYAGFYIDTEEFISEYVVTGELETKNDGQLYGIILSTHSPGIQDRIPEPTEVMSM